VRDWRRLIEQLAASFQENEERLRILHQIDQQVLDLHISLEEVFRSVLKNIVPFCKADLGCFYIHNETELLLLEAHPGDVLSLRTVRAIPIDDPRFRNLLEASPLIFQELTENKDSPFPPVNEETISRIVMPVDYDGSLWGLMCLESSEPSTKSLLANLDIHEFLTILRRQLEIAVRFRTQHKDLTQLSRIQNELFTRELDISESLD
jgi:hypothetical protein